MGCKGSKAAKAQEPASQAAEVPAAGGEADAQAGSAATLLSEPSAPGKSAAGAAEQSGLVEVHSDAAAASEDTTVPPAAEGREEAAGAAVTGEQHQKAEVTPSLPAPAAVPPASAEGAAAATAAEGSGIESGARQTEADEVEAEAEPMPEVEVRVEGTQEVSFWQMFRCCGPAQSVSLAPELQQQQPPAEGQVQALEQVSTEA
eukprot:TRINITY_DN23052_c0_g1_i1.p2 TRINITY_DN23052_c0_g1~~TRINITY_DN23052_c0_g1_i1.p2  ORF type:complete len:229 (+),score=59.84 TRINITY_DN23052_c0_g1_i1:80-688(+)